MGGMGFKEARQKAIEALKNGKYQHEARADIDVKNLLQLGSVSTQEVIDILRICGGSHHSASPHHVVDDIEVHIIKAMKPSPWYIKFYFLDPEIPELMFISVHPQ